jgi:RNA polymerase sigma-70 factor (ECF subfamily)
MTPMLAQRPRTDRAFERIYRHHVRDVYRYALAVLRSPEDAEDVTQTTFLNAYRNYERGEPIPSPDRWLMSIAHELCQQRARQERHLEEVALEDEALTAVPEDEGPTELDVRRALCRLPFDQRAALIMREVEERPYAEIAELLSVSTSAVETLVFEARRALREQLEGALTCHEAERAISRHLDGLLSRPERRMLREHLQECSDCIRLASDQRAQRVALRALANVPLPSSLSSFVPPAPSTPQVSPTGGIS